MFLFLGMTEQQPLDVAVGMSDLSLNCNSHSNGIDADIDKYPPPLEKLASPPPLERTQLFKNRYRDMPEIELATPFQGAKGGRKTKQEQASTRELVQLFVSNFPYGTMVVSVRVIETLSFILLFVLFISL